VRVGCRDWGRIADLIDRMNRRRQKLVLLSVLGFVIAVDLVHAILSWIFHPFTGPLNNGMHVVLLVAPIFYFAAAIWVCFKFAKWFSGTKFLSGNHYPSLILLAVIIGELAFTLLMPARSGSSRYHPLFPDFLGGILLAMATVIAGREYLQTRIGIAFVVLVAFFWIAGSLTVDSLWWTEGTGRGTGPMWRLPVISPLLVAASYTLMFGGGWLEECLDFPESVLKVGPAGVAVWCFMQAFLLTLCLRWLTRSRAWLISIALAASAVFLCWKALEWGGFIAD
jgi:hypothetical protein